MERPQAVRTRDRAAGGCPGLAGGSAPPACRSRGSAGASRARGPRPDASPATASRRPTSASGPPARQRPCSSATARSSPSDRRRRHGDFALARYNPNGSLDTSFSGDGRQRPTSTRRHADEGATAVALQGDGKIVAVGGRTGSGDHDFALARYNPNGSLDPSFSGDGKQTTDFGPRRRRRGGDPGRRQDRGRLVGDGSTPIDFALARYNPNGSLDTSFSGDGKQTTDFGASTKRTGWRSRRTARSSRWVRRWRLTTSRSPATTPTARSTRASPATASRRPTSAGSDGATGVALQGDGKIVAVGSERRSAHDFALARYNPNGSLDTSFSGDGKQTTDFGGTDGASGVALQGNGKIVAVGRRQGLQRPTTSRSPATTPTARSTRASPATASRHRLRGGPTGRTGWRSRPTARSSRLGRAGRRRRRLRARPLQPRRLARHELLRRRQADDRLRGLRRCERGGAPERRQDRRGRPRGPAMSTFALARYNPNGTLDTELLRRRQTDDRFGANDANGVAIQPNGKIVAVAGGVTSSRSRATTQRLARHELLRGRYADDRLRWVRRRGGRGGDPGRREDRRGRGRRRPSTSKTAS